MNPSNPKRPILALSAVLLVALLPGLVAAQTTERPIFGRYSENGALRMGASVGPDFFSSTTGLRLQGDAQYTLLEVSPRVYLDFAGQFAAVFASGVTVLDLVPKARIRYALLDPLSLYGDAGLGLAYSSLSAGPLSNTQLWGVLRFAGGLQYQISPNWGVTLEPLGLNVYFGTSSSFHYSILAGFLYRIM
jgi:hypothetical protein